MKEDCDQCQNAEKNDHIVEVNKMVPTPRTDAFQKGDSLLETWEQEWEAAISFARQLERELAKSQEAYLQSVERDDYLTQELAASQAEVNTLTRQLLKTESDLLQSQDINSFLDAEFRIACKRAEKAEAERDAYKKLALELCAELCQICKDPIHLKQLEELSK